MKTSIVQIGNSKGIRIPKPLLEQCGLEKEVELEVNGKRLIIRSASTPRKTWDDLFRKMADKKDDRLLGTPSASWDEKDWEWE